MSPASTYAPRFFATDEARELSKTRQVKLDLLGQSIFTTLLEASSVEKFQAVSQFQRIAPESLSLIARACERAHYVLHRGVDVYLPRGWSQDPETSVPSVFLAAFELTDDERDSILRSVLSSQALEGVHVSYERASRLLDEVLREPLPDIC